MKRFLPAAAAGVLLLVLQSCTVQTNHRPSISGDVTFDPSVYPIVVGVFPSTTRFNTTLGGRIVHVESGGETVLMLDEDVISTVTGGVEPYSLTFTSPYSEVGGVIAWFDEDENRVFNFPLETGWLPIKRIGLDDTIVLGILYDSAINGFRVHYSLNGVTDSGVRALDDVGSTGFNFVMVGSVP